MTEELSSRGANAEVKLVWEKRVVLVGGTEAFKQHRDDETGSFCGVFSTVQFTDRK